jgi:hypothetical protein
MIPSKNKLFSERIENNEKLKEPKSGDKMEKHEQ